MPTIRQLLVLGGSFLVGLVVVCAGVVWANSAVPQAAEIIGFSGNAGEWELTATLTRDGDSRELMGPMKMTHVGWCSQDGPQEKVGELRVLMHRLFSSIDAKVLIDGVECTFAGSLSDAYVGKLACPGRRPVQMLLWLK